MIPYRYMYATTAVHVLTINLQVIVSVLFSSSVDSHTGVPACVANLCAIQGQHSATSKHLTGRRKQSRGHAQTHSTQSLKGLQKTFIII